MCWLAIHRLLAFLQLALLALGFSLLTIHPSWLRGLKARTSYSLKSLAVTQSVMYVPLLFWLINICISFVQVI